MILSEKTDRLMNSWHIFHSSYLGHRH